MPTSFESAVEDGTPTGPTEVADNVSKPECHNYTVYQPRIGAMDKTHISLQCTVFLLGLSGNLILIFIIASHKRLRTTPNLFITNLAAADCVYLMLFIPCDIISKFGVQLPVFFCKTIYFCRFLTVGVSVYTLVALSIDRSLAITRPMSNLKSSRPGLITKLGLAIIWIAAVALATPYAVSTDIEVKRHRCLLIKHCYPFPAGWGSTYRTAMVLLKLVLYYLLPGALIAIFYGLMACKLMKTARAHERAAAASERANVSAASQIESRKKLAKLVLCLAGVFFVAWGLDYIAMLYFFLTKQVTVTFVWIKMIAKLLPSAYSASKPITLCIISKRFRAHFLQVVAQCCCCRRQAAGDAGGAGGGGRVVGGRGFGDDQRRGVRGRRDNADVDLQVVGASGDGGLFVRGARRRGSSGFGEIDDNDGNDVGSFENRRGSSSVNMTHLARRDGAQEAQPMLAVCQM